MKYGELNLGQIEALVNKLGGMEGVEKILAGGNTKDPLSLVVSKRLSIRVSFDRDLSLEEQIAQGGYKEVHSEIDDDHFQTSDARGPVTRTIELFHFDREIFTDDVRKAIKAEGFRDATIEELLAIGADSKGRILQLQFPIMALGSECELEGGVSGDITEDALFYPCLDQRKGKRCLFLYKEDNTEPEPWDAQVRFAAVRSTSRT